MNRRGSIIAVLICAGLILGAAPDASACWSTNVLQGVRPGFNEDLNDFAFILRDAQDTWCALSARTVLKGKLQALNTATPSYWAQWLSGGSLSFALQAGLVLGGTNDLDAELDGLLTTAANAYVRTLQSDCGFGTATWKNGNTCLEDYGIGSSTYGWIAAYRRLNGRDWRTSRTNAVSNMQWMLTNTTSCIRYNGERGNHIYRGVCNGTLSELAAGTASLLSFNHRYQTPAYGVGQITSLGVAAAGLETAEAPFTSGEFIGEHRTVLNALWKEGQAKTIVNEYGARFAAQDCYYMNPDGTLVSGQYCWDPAIFGSADIPEEGNMTHYRADMFNVKRFMEKYNLFQTGANDPNKYQFNTQRDVFKDDGTATAHLEFFGVARKDFYSWLSVGWLDSRPVMAGRRDKRGGIKRSSYFITGPSGGSLSAVTTTRSKTDPNANWTINDVNTGYNTGVLRSGDVVTIRNDAGWYWSATNEGGSTLYANQTNAITWERFTIVKISDGGVGPIAHGDSFALKTYNGVNYVTAVAGGGVDATGTSIGTNQTFVLDRKIDD